MEKLEEMHHACFSPRVEVSYKDLIVAAPIVTDYFRLVDLRHVKTSKGMIDAIIEYSPTAFNGGRILPTGSFLLIGDHTFAYN
jgi:hypothetical protein